MHIDRKTVERIFRDAVRNAIRESFAKGLPVYGRDSKSGKRVLLYPDGRQVEVVINKPA
jgi:Arc/MetJ family transcription regulator